MSDKPRVYGFCNAGCKWEVPHKDELNEVLEISNSALTKANEALTNENGALEIANTASTKANNAAAASEEAKALANNNNKAYNGNALGNDDVDAPYVYGSANPGKIGFKLPSSFNGFKGNTQPLGWSGELEIVYTIQVTYPDNSGTPYNEEYTLSVPFNGLWFKKSAPPSPFGGNNIWTSFGNFVTPDNYVYEHWINASTDKSLSSQFTIYFELNLDNNDWFWLSNLKIKYSISTELKDLNYTGLTIKVKNLNFFK